MIVKAVKIEPATAVKIFEKHNVLQEEVYAALNSGNPKFKKAGGNQYAAIGLSQSRHITVYFSYDEKTKEAEVETAYPSSKKQIKSYRKAR
ncbi:hypothetical protein HYU40_02930 [Candidatus Woesearchaeota archaeon]|nr:hypothetical protein [Candidatus Woesearchaeota archaeon]